MHSTTRNRRLLAGIAGVNLALAIAVSAGAVPRPGDDAVHTAAVSTVEEVVTSPARQPGDTVARPAAAAPTTAAAPATTMAPVTTVAKLKTTTPPTTKAPAKATQAAVAAAPAPTVPVTVAKVRRRVPTTAEVQTAIAELKQKVGGVLLFVSPTQAQLDQAADQICTAFDNGQSFAQVKATGLSMIPSSIVVAPATVDWAVRRAVTLYCPGHASKLV